MWCLCELNGEMGEVKLIFLDDVVGLEEYVEGFFCYCCGFW